MRSVRDCDEKLLAAIGSIVLESAYLEATITQLLNLLAQLDEQTSRVFISKRVMLDRKMQIVRELAEFRLPPDQCKKLKEIIDRLTKTNSARTLAVHGIWRIEIYAPPFLGPFAFQPTARKPDRRDHLTPQKAHQIAQQISDDRWQLLALFPELCQE